tara:strand:- start:45 stop:224 length:180 start_codon:yes stop_codon:yes gene_type:complete
MGTIPKETDVYNRNNSVEIPIDARESDNKVIKNKLNFLCNRKFIERNEFKIKIKDNSKY